MLKNIRRRAWSVLERTWQGWCDDDGFLLSAAMAYYAAFSLFPLCLVLIAVLGLVTRFSAAAQDAQQQLLDAVAQGAGPWLAGQLRELLRGVETKALLGGPLGLATLAFGAIGVFMQLETSFARIWHTPAGPSGWLAAIRAALRGRLTAFLMLLAAGGLLFGVFLANLVLSAVRAYVADLPLGSWVWWSVQTLFSVLTYTVLLGLIYKTFPKAPVRWREAIAGGLLAAFIWAAGQQVLVHFVIGENYSAYGLVGSFIAIMLWFYYASAVLFLGAEFVRAIGRGSQPDQGSRQSAPAG